MLLNFSGPSGIGVSDLAGSEKVRQKGQQHEIAVNV